MIAYQLDVRAIIHHFGGPTQLCRALAENSYNSISLKTVEKWRERKRIPGNWLAALAGLAQSRGESFDLTQFVREVQ